MFTRLSTSFIVLLFSSVTWGDEPSIEWDDLLAVSYEYLYEQQGILEAEFRMSKHERWDTDQESGTLTFSNSGKPTVEAEVVYVGSFSTSSNSWLWGWANSSIDAGLSAPLEMIREFGSEHGLNKLTDEKWDAEEVDGWEMAAVSNYLLKGRGVYRPPYDGGVLFLVITNIRHVSAR